jgi:hypothetical protein
MSAKPWAAFTTSLPDDQVEDGEQIFVLGGRNVAVAIGEVFTGLGCQVSPPESAGELGWEFDLRYRGSHQFSCRVTSFYPSFHLLFEDAATLFTAKNTAAAHAELAERFAAAMEGDPRFQHISWWSLKDGPPEPDEVASIAQRPRAADMSAAPLDRHGKQTALTNKQLGCLSGLGWLFVLWGALSGAMGLAYMIRSSEVAWDVILLVLSMLGVGLLLIFLARSRRADS